MARVQLSRPKSLHRRSKAHSKETTKHGSKCTKKQSDKPKIEVTREKHYNTIDLNQARTEIKEFLALREGYYGDDHHGKLELRFMSYIIWKDFRICERRCRLKGECRSTQANLREILNNWNDFRRDCGLGSTRAGVLGKGKDMKSEGEVTQSCIMLHSTYRLWDV